MRWTLVAALVVRSPFLAAQPTADTAWPGLRWETVQAQPKGSWWPPAASAILPGSGQLLQGADRGAAYLVVEAVLLVRAVRAGAEGRRGRDRYRDLAFRVARGPFMPQVRDTIFEYFEQMGKFLESGPFDADSGPSFVPAADEATFNGRIWALARRTFFANPDSIPAAASEEYQRAVDFYRARAVGPAFTWSWRNAQLEQAEFRAAIDRSDEAFRRATGTVGILLANHLMSVVDAFVSRRLGGPDRAELGATVARGLHPHRWMIWWHLQIGF